MLYMWGKKHPTKVNCASMPKYYGNDLVPQNLNILKTLEFYMPA